MVHYKKHEEYKDCWRLEYFDEAQMGKDPEAKEKFDQLSNKVRSLSSEISKNYNHLAVVARKKL